MKKIIAASVIVAAMFVGLNTASFAQDVSDDINNPLQLAIGSGATSDSLFNSIVESDLSNGVTGNPFGDIDFFNVTVANGFQLDSIELVLFDDGGSGGQAFLGFAENQLGGNPAIAAEQSAFQATALGFALVGFSDQGDPNLFDNLAAGAQGQLPGIGFDPNSPLDAGTYAFVFQNTGPDENFYALTFNGSAVPEPSTAFLFVGLGLAGLVKRRR